jgi:RNA polymerase sigma-70 factor (ECF subfamily)
MLDQPDGSNAAVQPEPAEPSRALAEALAELPVEQREVLKLAFFDGLSHAEIAARTEQPLGTIKTRLRLAMDKLRVRLGSLRDQIL